MSRIGKRPVAIPEGVEVAVEGTTVRVRGPRGELERDLGPFVSVAVEAEPRRVVVTRNRDDRTGRERHGLGRALVNNMIEGVSRGFQKVLEVIGVGYRAELREGVLRLSLGFASAVELRVPGDLTVEVARPSRPGIDGEIHVSGVDKERVGQFAARVREARPPDPYKGKGIRYRGEYLRKLAGKTFASGTA
jgi:large subunit ribosomal protein L6